MPQLEKNIKRYIYAPGVSVRDVVKDLYHKAITIALICDKRGVLLGVVTLSDIKQALLRGIDPKTPVRAIMNKEFTAASKGTSLPLVKKMAGRSTRYGTGLLSKIPIVDEKKRLVGLYTLPSSVKQDISTVLVTGGAGYVGSHLCRLLLKEGYRVIVLDALLFGDTGIKDLYRNKNFSLIKGDIGDIGTLAKAVQQADHVVHLAGIVGDPASSLNPLQTMEENHFATKMLVDLCKHYQISRFVFASSCSVYGASPAFLDEKSALKPVSLYAQSKIYSEREILRARDSHFHPIILRFGTVYGLSPRMRFDLVVNIMTAHAYFSKKITVDGGSQWRPLLHVEDAARACLTALTAPLQKVSGEIFNVGHSAENYRISEIAETIKEHIPQTVILKSDSVKDRRDYKVSFSKISKHTKFKTKHTLSKKIPELIGQFKKGKLKNWKHKKYSNYHTLRSMLEETL